MRRNVRACRVWRQPSEAISPKLQFPPTAELPRNEAHWPRVFTTVCYELEIDCPDLTERQEAETLT
jgi:hypothetical protein